VTLAYVAELSRARRGERLGWFSLARNAGYVVGPLAAGWMLLSMDPVSIFTVIGLLSSAAFLPILLLPETTAGNSRPGKPLGRQALVALWKGARTPAVWLAGGLDAKVLLALYATRAFLPLHAFSSGASMLSVGGFFALQQAAHIVLVPLGGRVSDRVGHLNAVGLGMAVLGAAVAMLPIAETGTSLMALAVVMGVSQALVFPSTLALVSVRVDEDNLGLGMGLVGTMKNAGKIAGPVVAGVLIYWLDFTATFRLIGAVLLLGAVAVWLSAHYSRRPAAQDRPVPA
jgi:MFS family permease